MVIGLKYGKAEQGDNAATDKTRALTREFIKEFTQKNGSVNCSELLGYNLSNQEEYNAAAKANLFRTKCPEYVKDAADILERILR
jgi:C_GCAxxG_C_C family probable redox protein